MAKIWVVVDSPYSWGHAKTGGQFAHELALQGHDVSVYCGEITANKIRSILGDAIEQINLIITPEERVQLDDDKPFSHKNSYFHQGNKKARKDIAREQIRAERPDAVVFDMYPLDKLKCQAEYITCILLCK